MTLEQLRARFFNPEKWIITGLSWAVLTLLFVSVIGLVQGQPFEIRMFLIEAALFFFVGAPMFGLLFRFISRRGQNNAR